MIRDSTTKKLKPPTSADMHRRKINKTAVFILVSLWGILPVTLFSACQSPQKTDMRSFAPADTLVYLEAGDLGEMLQSLTENKAWENSADGKPDFSPLKNIQVAVAVTGFESSEKQLTNESSVLNFKPQFVLIADTHAWKPAAVTLVENQIGKFARKTYGDDVKLEKSEKRDAKFFIWTSQSGRKLFAAASKSVVYVGNNEAILDKCLDVQRGDAENLLKNENLALARGRLSETGNLAFGYISPEGVAQIANIMGVSAAVSTSEEGFVRSFIAKNLPVFLQKNVKEAFWTARKAGEGIEDKFSVKIEAETSSVLKETLVAPANKQFQAAQFLPVQFNSITFYNMQNPQIAWRSLLLISSRQMDASSAEIFTKISNASLEESYGVLNGDTFLGAVDSEIITAKFDDEGEKSVVIATVKDLGKVMKAISEEINFKSNPEIIGTAHVWKSSDGTRAAAFVENTLILGERESVLNCLNAKTSDKTFAKTLQFQNLVKDSSSIASTITKDSDAGQKIIELLGKPKEKENIYTGFYTTSTRFQEPGFERKTTSDFGLLGTIISKFGE